MKYPIANLGIASRGYRFGEKTWYNKRHLGLDIICPTGTTLFAPCNGKIIKSWNGPDGGLTIWYQTQDKKIIRFLHLAQARGASETAILEGEVIGKTGHSGRLAGKSPHLHVDISRDWVRLTDFDNFIDPELFFAVIKEEAQKEEKEIQIKIQIKGKHPDGRSSGGCSQTEPYKIEFWHGDNPGENIAVLTHEILHAIYYARGFGDIHKDDEVRWIDPLSIQNSKVLDKILWEEK